MELLIYYITHLFNYQDDETNEDEMKSHVARMASGHKILVWKPEIHRLLGRPGYSWGMVLRYNLQKWVVWWAGFVWLRPGSRVGCSENGWRGKFFGSSYLDDRGARKKILKDISYGGCLWGGNTSLPDSEQLYQFVGPFYHEVARQPFSIDYVLGGSEGSKCGCVSYLRNRILVDWTQK
jgi:hypothetical protein